MCKYTVLLLLLFAGCCYGNDTLNITGTVTVETLVAKHHILSWQKQTSVQQFAPNETVLIFIDVWCWHPFPSMRKAVTKVVPRINRLVDKADALGMRVLWAPYDSGLERHFRPYIDHSVNMNNPVFGDAFWKRLTTLNSDDGTHRGNRQLCNRHSAMPGMHPRLRVKPHHLTIKTTSTKTLRDMGITTAMIGGVSLSECLIHRPMGAVALLKAGLKTMVLEGMAFSGGNPLSAEFMFQDDEGMTRIWTSVFHRFFNGSVALQ